MMGTQAALTVDGRARITAFLARDQRIQRPGLLDARSIAQWIVGAGLVLGWSKAGWAFNARINRPVVHETIAAGQTAHGTVEIENQGDDPVKLEVYLQDWEYIEGGSGNKLFSVPGSSQWSASKWISYYPEQLDLPARGKGVVEYTIRVPQDAVGGKYAVLFFESMLARSAPNEKGVSVQYTGRIGSLFEIEVAGTVHRTAEISQVTIGRPDEDRPLSIGYTLKDMGNVILRPKAFFNIVDAQGKYFGRGEFKPIYASPGRSGSTTTEWTGNLSPGDYMVVLTVDLGEDQVLASEHPIQVKRAVVIEDVKLKDREHPTAEVGLHNDGNFEVDGQGTLAITTPAGVVIAQGTFSAEGLAPNEHRHVSVTGLGRASSGRYDCRVQLLGDQISAERTVPCDLP